MNRLSQYDDVLSKKEMDRYNDHPLSKYIYAFDIDNTLVHNKNFEMDVGADGLPLDDPSFITGKYYLQSKFNKFPTELWHHLVEYKNISLICISARPVFWFRETLIELNRFGIKPDRLYLRSSSKSQDIAYKIRTVKRLLKDGVTSFSILDDNVECIKQLSTISGPVRPYAYLRDIDGIVQYRDKEPMVL